MKIVGAVHRLHQDSHDCWCKPDPTKACQCCGGPAHRDVDVRPDLRERGAFFTDVQTMDL